jgi:hypothetical protein
MIESHHLEVLGFGGKMLLKCYLQDVECASMEWIDLASFSDKGRALVNAVMNFQVL